MLRASVVILVAMLVGVANVVAEPFRTGTWLFERPGQDLGIDVAADGSGTVVMGNVDGPVKFDIDGDTLVFMEPGKEATSFTITSRSEKSLSLVSGEGWEGELTLIKAKPVESAAAEPGPAQTINTKNTAQPAGMNGVTTKGVVGGWQATDPNGKARYVYFSEDGQFLLIGANGYDGGRYKVENGTLKIRYNKTRGFFNYLSPVASIQISSIKPGQSFVTRENYGGVTHDLVHTFDRADHPLGTIENTNHDMSFYGRWLVKAADGRREVWEFRPNGSVLVNRKSGFEALRWSLDGDILTIKVLTSATNMKVRNFQRGRGFQVGPEDRPDTFLYMDGIHYSPPFESPAPTQRQLDVALAQELAITQKANATSAAINQSTAAMADMMEMMTDDIADRPYRYEWLEVD